MSVYQFENSTDYFNFLMKNWKGRKKPLTLRQFADLLGYKSPRSIAMVLKGQRSPSQEMITQIAQVAQLNAKEILYLQLLVKRSQYENKKSETPSEITQKIEKLRPAKKSTHKMEDEVFKYISEWYHLPLMMYLIKNREIPDFSEVSDFFQNKVSPEKLQTAYFRMRDLNILSRLHEVQESTFDIPSKAIQLHHSQMMDRAQEALKNDSVHDRDFQSNTFKMKPEKLDLAKKRLRDFLDEFILEFHDDQADAIFQTNYQMFQHTRKSK